MKKNMRTATSSILIAALLVSSFAQAQNGDLFPNIKDPPKINDNGPVTIDESGDDDLPFIPVNPLTPGAPTPAPNGTIISPMVPSPDYVPRRPTQPINNSEPDYNRGRPSGLMISTANVPSQYSCPLFENSSYQDLNIAISSLTNAIQGVSDQCQSTQPQIESVKQTSDQIKRSIEQLQAYVQDPQGGYANINQLQSNVGSLVTGIDRMSEVFKNVSTLSKSCGRENLSWGKVALELNNVINSASPFLLLLTATQPALSLAVKGAIMGTVVGSNVISTMAQVIQSNTVKMEIADQRNAVLQNTCQFTKVAKKISYIQLARSGRFAELEKQLKDNVNTYAMKVTGGSSLLNTMWTVRGNIRNNIGGLQAAVRSDKEALEEMNLRIREAQNNAFLICIQGKQMVQMSQDETSFPNSVQQGILDAYQQNNTLKNIDLTDFQSVYGPRNNIREEDEKLKKKVQSLIRTYQSLLNRIVNYPEEPQGEQISSCAATTMAFVQHIQRMITETTNIMVEDLDKMENDLSQNEEYRKWKLEFDKIINEQENTNRMARVLKELTKPGSGVYNRSEFAEAAANLKRSLLGPRQGIFAGESPVYAWLDYKRTQFAKAKGSFDKTIGEILSKSFALTNSGKGYGYGAATHATRQQFQNDFQMAMNMTILNKKTLPINSPQWELACIDLEKAIKDYSDALDHLGTTHFMCDMIYDYLDNSVDPKIISYCRGQSDYTGVQRQKQKSYIDQATADLSRRPAPKMMSIQEQANLVAKKMTEIGCRLPKAGDAP